MGWAKEQWMKQQEQGWHSVGDKYVCSKCFKDEATQEFIRDNAIERRCSYCERQSKKPIAAEMDQVIEFIAAGINYEYEDPVQSVGWDSSEGGYLLPTIDSWDLLSNLGLGDGNENVFEDLRAAFSDHEWVHRNPYSDLECDALRYNWDAFAEQVKHRTRFVFFRLTTAGKMDWEPEPHQILDSLHRIVDELGLVETIPSFTKFFRAHQHEPTETLAGAKRLGTPPNNYASHSRMSPAGIPMLYVAGDSKTAAAEVCRPHSKRNRITTATFANLRPLRILDLSHIPVVPSLFDENNRHQRMPLIFLQEFAEEISKPISHDVKAYEYVPTQVMTEYFRYLFHLPTEQNPNPAQPLDGIAFRSSRNGSGINFTLFIDQQGCADHESEVDAVMVLRRTKKHTISGQV